jgi:hypothetical protein
LREQFGYLHAKANTEITEEFPVTLLRESNCHLIGDQTQSEETVGYIRDLKPMTFMYEGSARPR